MKDSNKTFFCIKKVGFAIILFATTLFSVKAQVTILNANISPYNITPRTLLDASINNTKNDVQVIMQAKIISASGEVLVDVTSGFFLLKKGLTNSGQITIPINSVVYGSGEKTNMIKSSHSLPSGKYSYCATITAIDVAEQYCQDMESESSSFLFLVFPPDKDEIETRYPVLTWTHSEPFALTNQNEFFRVMVVELSKGQSPEAAVNTNIPVYMKNYLTSHQVQGRE